MSASAQWALGNTFSIKYHRVTSCSLRLNGFRPHAKDPETIDIYRRIPNLWKNHIRATIDSCESKGTLLFSVLESVVAHKKYENLENSL